MKNEPHPRNPYIEFNDPENPYPEETFNKFLERRKDFYKEFYEDFIETDGRPFPNLEAEKTVDDLVAEYPNWFEILKRNTILFEGIDRPTDTFMYGEKTLLFEDALSRFEKSISNCSEKNELIKWFIKKLDEGIRTYKTAKLLPGRKKEQLDLLKYHLQLLENLKDILFEKLDPSKIEEKKENVIPLNPFPRIFKNYDSYKLFESLRSDVREQNKLADFSFIYRRMQKDGYVFQGIVDTEFRNFLHDISVEIETKTKLLDYCKTEIKETNYKTKKLLFKHL